MQNTNEWLKEQLKQYSEKEYQKFSSALLPGADNVLGVRLPRLRKLAKELAKGDWESYLSQALDDSMEETLLQGMTLGYVKASFAEKKPYLDFFVGKIENWSVCDSTCSSMKPVYAEDVEKFFAYACQCVKDDREFVIRFGVVMILDYYITENYIHEVLPLLDEVVHDGYYVKMAVAWAISICYVKFPEETMILLQNSKMDDFTYNKALQKITESHQVSKEDKAVIRSMKRRSR